MKLIKLLSYVLIILGSVQLVLLIKDHIDRSVLNIAGMIVVYASGCFFYMYARHKEWVGKHL